MSSEARVVAAFEKLERTRQVALLRYLAGKCGCSVRDPSSAEANRVRTVRTKPANSTRTEPVQYSGDAAPALVRSGSSSKKVAAKKTPTKPKVSILPTEDEQRVIRTLNTERLRYIKGDPGFACDKHAVELMRPWIELHSVDALLLVVEWWMTRRATKDFRPLKYFRPKTLFGKEFPTYFADATAWKSDGTHVEYDADALWRETMARGDT